MRIAVIDRPDSRRASLCRVPYTPGEVRLREYERWPNVRGGWLRSFSASSRPRILVRTDPCCIAEDRTIRRSPCSADA